MKRKSQTATEYLVILAIIIVIALIVVSILGGSIGLGGGEFQKIKLELHSQVHKLALLSMTLVAN